MEYKVKETEHKCIQGHCIKNLLRNYVDFSYLNIYHISYVFKEAVMLMNPRKDISWNASIGKADSIDNLSEYEASFPLFFLVPSKTFSFIFLIYHY